MLQSLNILSNTCYQIIMVLIITVCYDIANFLWYNYCWIQYHGLAILS